MILGAFFLPSKKFYSSKDKYIFKGIIVLCLCLLMSVGVDKVKEMAQRLGLKGTLQEVAGLTLGINSTTPLEMADAYATIANGGTYYEPQCIVSITDKDGNVIVDNSHPEGERVLSEGVAYAAIQAMEGVVSASGGTGYEARLSNGQPVAGKTGTTDDRKDHWFIGCTPSSSSSSSFDQPPVPMWFLVSTYFSI